MNIYQLITKAKKTLDAMSELQSDATNARFEPEVKDILFDIEHALIFARGDLTRAILKLEKRRQR